MKFSIHTSGDELSTEFNCLWRFMEMSNLVSLSGMIIEVSGAMFSKKLNDQLVD